MPATRNRDEMQGRVFRQTRPKYAELALAKSQSAPLIANAFATVMATGSIRDGGRFNPPSAFGALYVALDPETALLELAQQIVRDALPFHSMLPRIMLEIDIELSQILDLTQQPLRDAVGLEISDIVPLRNSAAARQRGFHLCQAVGAKAHQTGFEAILYPSATGVGENLAIFPDRVLSDARVRPVIPWKPVAEQQVAALVQSLRVTR